MCLEASRALSETYFNKYLNRCGCVACSSQAKVFAVLERNTICLKLACQFACWLLMENTVPIYDSQNSGNMLNNGHLNKQTKKKLFTKLKIHH